MLKTLIRQISLSDFETINVIAKQEHDLHVALRPDLYRIADPVMSRYDYEKTLEEGIGFVVEENQEVIGYIIGFVIDNENPLLVPGRVLVISALAVDQTQQKKGYGKLLTESLIKVGKNHGCDRVELQVVAVNENAVDFYKHLGFEAKTEIMQRKI